MFPYSPARATWDQVSTWHSVPKNTASPRIVHIEHPPPLRVYKIDHPRGTTRRTISETWALGMLRKRRSRIAGQQVLAIKCGEVYLEVEH